jgi:hypothetical protein
MSVERPGRCRNTAGPGIPLSREARSQCPQITELASGAITAIDTITIELVETDEMASVVIVRWPLKPSVLHPYRFPAVADVAARTLLLPSYG